jgi:hypothetical protein
VGYKRVLCCTAALHTPDAHPWLQVANKPTRLSLNVKGEGYAIHQQLQLEDGLGGCQVLAPQAASHLDFGQVCAPIYSNIYITAGEGDT